MSFKDLLLTLRRHLLASIFGMLSFLLIPWIIWRGPMIEEAESRLQDLEREWRQIQINAERAEGLQSDIETLEAALAGAEQRLLDVEEVAVNYEFFWEQEQSTNVSFEGFSQDPLSEKVWKLADGKELADYIPIPFSLELTGTYPALLQFLDSIENGSLLGRIGYVSIDRFKDTSGAVLLRSTVVCHVLGGKNE